VTRPLARLLARAARPPVRFGGAATTPAAAAPENAEVSAPAPVARASRTRAYAAPTRRATRTALPALMPADERAARALDVPPETATPSGDAAPTASAETSAPPEPTGAATAADTAKVEAKVTPKHPEPPDDRPVEPRPATASPEQRARSVAAAAVPAAQRPRPAAATARPQLDELLVPVAEPSEPEPAGAEGAEARTSAPAIPIEPQQATEVMPMRIDAPRQQTQRGVARTVRNEERRPSPAAAPPAEAPAQAAAAPTVVIDQIHVITPPAPAPVADPLASLAAHRTGSSLHGDS
jgi:hypothetical protein